MQRVPFNTRVSSPSLHGLIQGERIPCWESLLIYVIPHTTMTSCVSCAAGCGRVLCIVYVYREMILIQSVSDECMRIWMYMDLYMRCAVFTRSLVHEATAYAPPACVRAHLPHFFIWDISRQPHSAAGTPGLARAVLCTDEVTTGNKRAGPQVARWDSLGGCGL